LKAVEHHCGALPLQPARLTGKGHKDIRNTQVARAAGPEAR
jgi:hypothetical protein